MNYVNFNRTKTSSDALVGDQNTIYFTPDTHEIVMGGEVYGKSTSTAPNDGKLTIKVNDEVVGTFTANQNSDSNVNIDVPAQITPGSGTLTIKHGDTTLGSFSADSQTDLTVTIPVSTTSTECSCAAPGNGTLTITQGGTTLGSFTANLSTDLTVEIPVTSSECSCAAPGNGTLSITVNNETKTFSANQATDESVSISIPSAPNNGKLTIKQGETELGSFTADLSGDTVITISESSSCNCAAPGNGTLTIKVNGLEKGTFTANLSTDSEIDITTGGDDVKLGGENLVKYNGSYILEPLFVNKALDTDVTALMNADVLAVKHRNLIPGAHFIAEPYDDYVVLCSFSLHDTLVDGLLYSLSFYFQNTEKSADYKISHNLGQTPTETEQKWVEVATCNGAVDLRIEFTGYKHKGITQIMFMIEPLLPEPLDVIIHSVKLEKGNTVTDWSLPLYDTQVYPKGGSGPVIATGYSGDICLPTDYLPLSGGTMSGNIIMGGSSANDEITWPYCGSIKPVQDGIRIVTNEGLALTLHLDTVYTSGNMGAAAFFEISDIRKKDIIAELSLDKCYSLVDKCQTIIYSLKGEDKKQVGMIAQEIELFFPEVVATDAEGFKSLAYDRLVVICFKVLKDIIKRLEKLELDESLNCK